MNPDHLLDQADHLLQWTPGPGRQADLRRAISTAYYTLFHYVLRAAADMSVGAATKKTNPELYKGLYRSVDHAQLRKLALGVRNLTKDANIIDFADAIVSLQKSRLDADYDPLFRAKRSDVITKLSAVRAAIAKFEAAAQPERNSFLTSILFVKR
jgi:hypothetical protein